MPVGLGPTTGRVPPEGGGGDRGRQQVFRRLVPDELVGIAADVMMVAWMAMDLSIRAAPPPSIILPRIPRRSSASRVPGGVPILSVVVCRVA